MGKEENFKSTSQLGGEDEDFPKVSCHKGELVISFNHSLIHKLSGHNILCIVDD